MPLIMIHPIGGDFLYRDWPDILVARKTVLCFRQPVYPARPPIASISRTCGEPLEASWRRCELIRPIYWGVSFGGLVAAKWRNNSTETQQGEFGCRLLTPPNEYAAQFGR